MDVSEIKNPHFHPENSENFHSKFTIFLSNLLVKVMNMGNEVGELFKSVNEILEKLDQNKAKSLLFRDTVYPLNYLN